MCTVQEIKYKKSGIRVYESGEEKYKFWWNGGRGGRGSLGEGRMGGKRNTGSKML